MAFNVNSKAVINYKECPSKASPWRCNMCHKAPEVLLKINIDYDNLIICKKCLTSNKKLILNKEKELKNDRNSKKKPKKK